MPSKEDLKFACEFVSNLSQKSEFQIAVADNIGYHTKIEKHISGKVINGFSGCNAGITTIGIDSVGNARSLYDNKFIEGNLANESLYDIWNSPDAFAYNRNFHKSVLSGKCADCDVWYKCAAGCRSFNWFFNEDMYESKVCLKMN